MAGYTIKGSGITAYPGYAARKVGTVAFCALARVREKYRRVVRDPVVRVLPCFGIKYRAALARIGASAGQQQQPDAQGEANSHAYR